MRLIFLLSILIAPQAHADLYSSLSAASFELLIDNHLGGSGAIVSEDGIGLVAAHTVMGQRRLEIRSRTLGRQDVEVVAIDAGHDIALIRLPFRKGGYPFLPVAKKTLKAGKTIFLFGAPLYRHGVMLTGAVARARPAFEYLPDMGYYVRVIHVSGPAPPGSSGGPWVNQRGQIVGVQSGLMHEGGSPVGIAYMAPLAAIRSLLRRKQSSPTTTVGIGFEELWEQRSGYAHRYPQRQEGLVAAKVKDTGAGYLSGIRAGDLVIRADGHTVIYRDDLLRRMRAKRPGDRFSLVLRAVDGTERTVEMSLNSVKNLSNSKR